jgi:hypothetical protein
MPVQVTDSPITATEVNVARIFSDDYAFAIPSIRLGFGAGIRALG